MSIMDMFRNIRQPNQATPAVAQAQIASAANNPTVPSPATPVSTGSLPAVPAAQQGEGSPLAKFDDLWKTDPNQNQNTPSITPNFNLDANKLKEAAGKLNFTGHISQELVTKAANGDAAALVDVINQAGQLGFANAMAATNELLRNSFSQAQGTLQQQILPSAIRNSNIDAEMQREQIFSDPTVSPMVGMLRDQLARKYPTAPPAEIASMAKEYLVGVSQRVVTGSGGQVVTPSPRQQSMRPPEEDWGKFFEI